VLLADLILAVCAIFLISFVIIVFMNSLLIINGFKCLYTMSHQSFFSVLTLPSVGYVSFPHPDSVQLHAVTWQIQKWCGMIFIHTISSNNS